MGVSGKLMYGREVSLLRRLEGSLRSKPPPHPYRSLPDTPIKNVLVTQKLSASGIQALSHSILGTYLLLTAFPNLRHCHYSKENENKVEICSRKFEVRWNSNMVLAAIMTGEQLVFSSP